ncbi:transposase [Rubripirellula sp.]|nr:transposase [Rubripirellula sp.]MDF1844288.1 transposase [Rubripirellula sp.]
MPRPRKKRRSFSDTEKADAVRRHLKDGVPVLQIANDLDVQPTMVHNWINTTGSTQRWLNTALAQLEQLFGSPRAAKAQVSKQDAMIQQLREKLDSKNELISELMEENIRSKKEKGAI